MGDVINSIMTTTPEFIEITGTVREVMEKMDLLNIRHVPVLSEGSLVGIISDRDIYGLFLKFGADGNAYEKESEILDYPVNKLMSSDLITVNPETDISEAIDLMLEYKVGALPVVDAEEGDLRGIVSYLDVLKAAQPAFS